MAARPRRTARASAAVKVPSSTTASARTRRASRSTAETMTTDRRPRPRVTRTGSPSAATFAARAESVSRASSSVTEVMVTTPKASIGLVATLVNGAPFRGAVPIGCHARHARLFSGRASRRGRGQTDTWYQILSTQQAGRDRGVVDGVEGARLRHAARGAAAAPAGAGARPGGPRPPSGPRGGAGCPVRAGPLSRWVRTVACRGAQHQGWSWFTASDHRSPRRRRSLEPGYRERRRRGAGRDRSPGCCGSPA